MQQGWIKLHRRIKDSAVFDNPKLLKTWVWCLCKATHTEHEVIVGKQVVHLQGGQFVFGRLKAAEELKMNDRTVYDYIKILENLKMISVNSNNKFSVVTIVNWALYQEEGGADQHQTTMKSTMQNTIENNTYKNVKNEQNVKKFIKPTIEEVHAYCVERNNGIDAQRFVDFYEAKGWVVGKTKMKDWKAAIRTWEQNNKKGTKVYEGNVTGQRSEYEKVSF